ncbi:MAG: LysE family transporter [Gammaproteobacteria bacterium]
MSAFLSTFLTIASLHFLGLVSPGPDFALVTKNAFIYPTRTAVMTAVGIALGIAIHVSYCILGLAVLIVHTPLVFTLIKYLGAAYLIYIGVKSCLSSMGTQPETPSDPNTPPIKNLTDWQAIKQGLLCNALNPKASLFILGLFTLAIRPNTPAWQQAIYGGWMVLSTFLWFGLLSLIITHPHARHRLIRIQPFIIRLMGVLLIIFGVELALFAGVGHAHP